MVKGKIRVLASLISNLALSSPSRGVGKTTTLTVKVKIRVSKLVLNFAFLCP